MVKLGCQERPYMSRIAGMLAFAILVGATTGGCAMSEEMRRIEAMQKEKDRREKGMTTDLSGEQIFIRSCNTCHPGAKAGMGPALDKLGEHFSTDEKLISFLRAGVGAMPPQPKEVLNDVEMDNLVGYLRTLTFEEPPPKKPEDKPPETPKKKKKKKKKRN